MHWPRNLAQFSHWPGGTGGTAALTLAEDARLSAMMWVSLSDTIVACWDAKFHYWAWRPQSAIQLADTDGNDNTTAVPGWLPLGPVPPHPEYPAAHTCVSSAVAETLASYFDTRTFTFSFDARTVTPAVAAHQYASVDEFVQNNFMGRIWGGQHFRHSRTMESQWESWCLTGYVTTSFIQDSCSLPALRRIGDMRRQRFGKVLHDDNLHGQGERQGFQGGRNRVGTYRTAAAAPHRTDERNPYRDSVWMSCVPTPGQFAAQRTDDLAQAVFHYVQVRPEPGHQPVFAQQLAGMLDE